jgi:hypothetical protein
LSSIKQSRLAGEIAQLQREDTLVSLDQGETIRRLTLLNMAFLPLSFIAGVFGMNTNETQHTSMWAFALTAMSLLIATMIFSFSGLVVRQYSKTEKLYSANATFYEILCSKLGQWYRTQVSNSLGLVRAWFTLLFLRKRRRMAGEDWVEEQQQEEPPK